MAEAIRLTKEGYEQYLEEIKKVKLELRDLRLSKGKIANEQGNSVRENSGFADVRLREDVIMQRLADMQAVIKNVEIVEETQTLDCIDINSTVTFEMDDGYEVERSTVKLVATPINDFGNHVSINCPLGKAILSKKVNEEVTYCVGGLKIKVKILAIEK